MCRLSAGGAKICGTCRLHAQPPVHSRTPPVWCGVAPHTTPCCPALPSQQLHWHGLPHHHHHTLVVFLFK
eukprot:365856-Chlamydomonas_euryale.AAC.1